MATSPGDVLRLETVDKPVAREDKVQVRVRATSVGRDTWHVMAGLPYPIRMAGFVLRRPKYSNHGRNLAGTVEAVGSNDLTLDTVGNRSVHDLRRALAQGGKAAVTGFTTAKLMGVSLRGGKDVAMVKADVTAKDLGLLSELIEAGTVRPQIDRRYRFAEIPTAIAYLEQDRARGRVVVGPREGSP